MLRRQEISTSTPNALAESQVRLLNALARPILVADETGRLLYRTPALRECLDHASAQERNQLEPPLFGIDGQFTFTSGTGRFAGATGGGDASGVQNLATGDATVELVGTISNVGPN